MFDQGYRWSNPNHAVNTSERMRDTALNVIARKQRNWEGFWRVTEASFEPRKEYGDERDVLAN